MAKKKNNYQLIILLILLLAILLGFAYWKAKGKEQGEKVQVEALQKRTIKETVGASGKIFPETEVKISSDVSGEVVALYVEEGDSVSNGQLLAKIDPDAYLSTVERGEASVNNAKAQAANSEAGVERSRAQMLQAQAEVTRIKAQMENTKKTHDRNIQLHKDGVISQADFEASELNLASLEANLSAAEANYRSTEAGKKSAEKTVEASQFSVKSAAATLKEMKTNLQRTEIYARTNGIVSTLNIEKGERVVGTAQMAGTELMRIANLNTMEVQVDVSENDVLRVELNDVVEIEVDAYQDRVFKGYVTQIANSASNSGTGALTTDQVTNFVVKIRMNPESYADLISPVKPYPFRPGMSASVDIFTHTSEDVLTLPIQAVTTREEEKKGKKKTQEEGKIKEVVFVVEADSVKMLEVTSGIQDNDYIEIKTGIEEGTEVVIGPYNTISKKLKQGDEVKVVTEDELYGDQEKKKRG